VDPTFNFNALIQAPITQPRRDSILPAHEERLPDAALIETPFPASKTGSGPWRLEALTIVARPGCRPVVAREGDDRIAGNAEFIEGAEQPADLPVELIEHRIELLLIRILRKPAVACHDVGPREVPIMDIAGPEM
jgi:hypothetical protein